MSERRKYDFRRLWNPTLAVAVAVVLAWSTAAWLDRSAGVTRLGDPMHQVDVLELSADGRTAVGMLYDLDKGPTNYMHAYVWSRRWGLRRIDARAGGYTYVESVSADGTTVVGRFYDRAGSPHLYRWTRFGGLQDLGAPDGLDPAINSTCGDRGAIVSGDGSVIVGSLKDGAGNFRWTRQAGFRRLDLPGRVTAATPDGAVIVGKTDGPPTHVFRWSRAGGYEDLGAPAKAAQFDYVTVEAVSADGSTIVGIYMVPTGEPEAGDIHGYRWTRAGGFQELPGADADVCGVSSDGSLVVGRVRDLGAVRWRGAGPPQHVGPTALNAIDAIGLSADGRTIAGRAMVSLGHFQGYIVRGS